MQLSTPCSNGLVNLSHSQIMHVLVVLRPRTSLFPFHLQRLFSLQESDDLLDYEPRVYTEEGDANTPSELETISIPDENPTSFLEMLNDFDPRFKQLVYICKPVKQWVSIDKYFNRNSYFSPFRYQRMKRKKKYTKVLHDHLNCGNEQIHKQKQNRKKRSCLLNCMKVYLTCLQQPLTVLLLVHIYFIKINYSLFFMQRMQRFKFLKC